MIDCENEVFTRVKTAITTIYPNAYVTSEYVRSPARFPHISIVMSDNRVDDRHTINSEMSNVAFTIDIYSNKQNGKKSECKQIVSIIDDTLFAMNFIREAYATVPNLENTSIYRLTVRYIGQTNGIYFFRR